jgi:hypothetical protein
MVEYGLRCLINALVCCVGSSLFISATVILALRDMTWTAFAGVRLDLCRRRLGVLYAGLAE